MKLVYHKITKATQVNTNNIDVTVILTMKTYPELYRDILIMLILPAAFES